MQLQTAFKPDGLVEQLALKVVNTLKWKKVAPEVKEALIRKLREGDLLKDNLIFARVKDVKGQGTRTIVQYLPNGQQQTMSIEEFENQTLGCAKGIERCKRERGPQQGCAECDRATNLKKSCEISFEHNYFGEARSLEKDGRFIWFHWAQYGSFNMGTDLEESDTGVKAARGIKTPQDWEDLFKFTRRVPFGGKPKTPVKGDFICGLVNPSRHHKTGQIMPNKLQYDVFQMMDFAQYRFFLLIKHGIQDKLFQNMKPQNVIASLISNGNQVLGIDPHKTMTPRNAPETSQEPFLYAATVAVAVFGLKPENTECWDMSKCGSIPYMDFLLNCESFEKIVKLEIHYASPRTIHLAAARRWNGEVVQEENDPTEIWNHALQTATKDSTKTVRADCYDYGSTQNAPYSRSTPYFPGDTGGPNTVYHGPPYFPLPPYEPHVDAYGRVEIIPPGYLNGWNLPLLLPHDGNGSASSPATILSPTSARKPDRSKKRDDDRDDDHESRGGRDDRESRNERENRDRDDRRDRDRRDDHAPPRDDRRNREWNDWDEWNNWSYRDWKWNSRNWKRDWTPSPRDRWDDGRDRWDDGRNRWDNGRNSWDDDRNRWDNGRNSWDDGRNSWDDDRNRYRNRWDDDRNSWDDDRNRYRNYWYEDRNRWNDDRNNWRRDPREFSDDQSLGYSSNDQEEEHDNEMRQIEKQKQAREQQEKDAQLALEMQRKYDEENRDTLKDNNFKKEYPPLRTPSDPYFEKGKGWKLVRSSEGKSSSFRKEVNNSKELIHRSQFAMEKIQEKLKLREPPHGGSPAAKRSKSVETSRSRIKRKGRSRSTEIELSNYMTVGMSPKTKKSWADYSPSTPAIPSEKIIVTPDEFFMQQPPIFFDSRKMPLPRTPSQNSPVTRWSTGFSPRETP